MLFLIYKNLEIVTATDVLFRCFIQMFYLLFFIKTPENSMNSFQGLNMIGGADNFIRMYSLSCAIMACNVVVSIILKVVLF